MNLFSFDRRGSDIKPPAAGAPIEAQVTARSAHVGVELSLTPLGHQTRLLEGRSLQHRVRSSGLVDTGTSMSLISTAIADALSLETLHTVEIHTALGSERVPCFDLEIRLVDVYGTRSPPMRTVVARIPGSREDMVIGLDILRRFRFEWDGPAATLRIWPAGSVARP